MANGLAAFLAFQAWGNDPEHFPSELKDLLGNTLGAETPLPAESPAWNEFDSKLWEHKDYGFVAPTRPKTYVINSRTRRARTNPSAPHEAARLFDSQGWTKMQTQLHETGFRSGEPLILISPAPIFGVNIIESLQGAAAYAIKASGADLESWQANPQNMIDLFQTLFRLRPSACIILSGDVHYAFSTFIKLVRGERVIPVAQFTSSALKNPSPGLLRLVGGEMKETYWWENPAEETDSLGQAGLISLGRGRLNDYTETAVMATSILNTSNVGLLGIDGREVDNVYLRPSPAGTALRTWSRTHREFSNWGV